MNNGPMVKLNNGLFVNWVFGITRVHLVTAAEKAASNDVNFREADEGDVIIKFNWVPGLQASDESEVEPFIDTYWPQGLIRVRGPSSRLTITVP